jgi:hypothetical protein
MVLASHPPTVTNLRKLNNDRGISQHFSDGLANLLNENIWLHQDTLVLGQ